MDSHFGMVCLVLFNVLFQGHISMAHEKWTCTTTTDLFGSSPNAELEERVSKLEERIKSQEEREILRTPIDCEEIYKNGTRNNGVYKISPDGRSPFPVYCDMTNGGWTLMQRRVDGIVAFNRTWAEYVTGFDDLGGSFWLGLEKIHRLTREGSQIYFDMERLNGSKLYAHYKAFRVDDAVTAYTMHVDIYGYNGSIQELFSNQNGMKFTTLDRDNDAMPDSCSLRMGNGGWWYRGCYTFNFNGIYGKQNEAGLCYHNYTTFHFLSKVDIKVKEI